MRFRLPDIDNLSFWLGVILSTIFWLIVNALRPIFNQIREVIRARQAENRAKSNSVSVLEEHYRRVVLQKAQRMHMAEALFSLDEIVVPPMLLAPPARIEPGTPLFIEDIVSTTIPYLPAWPELGAIYNTHTLQLSEALSGNSDIVLTGHSGMGKTVALAYLASCLARKDAVPGLPENTLPFLIHVADLDLPIKKDDALAPIIASITEKISVLEAGRIPDLVKNAFTDGRALLLLDGTDELTPDGLKEAVEFIKAVKKSFPKTRMVTTASTEFLDGLVSLNFIPFGIAAWTPSQRQKFLEKWGDLWVRFVSVESWVPNGSDQIDPLLLNGWLMADCAFQTPLEMTLKAWGAYAGDIRGPRTIDALDTHFRRIISTGLPREAPELLALQVVLACEPIFDPRKAREWVKSLEAPDTPPGSEAPDSTKPKGTKKQQAPSLGLISRMADNKLLTQHNNRMRFFHPVFGGYLAGKALVNYKAEALLDQPPWVGKFLAMQYYAACGDATSLVTALLSKVDRPLFRPLFYMARWLPDSPRQAPWRGRVMAKLAELLHQEGQPLGLRGQALAAFVKSGDPSTAVLLRQLLVEPATDLLQLVALGCGAIQDAKAIKELIGLLGNISPMVRRSACLALVNIGTSESLDAVASILLHADEDTRRAAAEALATHAGEGHAMLREGAGMKDDLLIRRACVYGLARVSATWADEIITKMQVEDDQWAVRNAAVEVVENRLHPNPHVPKRLAPPSEAPWLITFASKQGMGISPDKTPTDLLLLAMRSGTEEEKLGALTYLRMMPMEGVFGAFYQAMYSEPGMRESIFQTLTEMASRGVEIPDPAQYGVGV